MRTVPEQEQERERLVAGLRRVDEASTRLPWKEAKERFRKVAEHFNVWKSVKGMYEERRSFNEALYELPDVRSMISPRVYVSERLSGVTPTALLKGKVTSTPVFREFVEYLVKTGEPLAFARVSLVFPLSGCGIYVITTASISSVFDEPYISIPPTSRDAGVPDVRVMTIASFVKELEV